MAHAAPSVPALDVLLPSSPLYTQPTHASIRCFTAAQLYTVASDARPRRHQVVHRLDESTSGVLVLARTSDAQRNLYQQFRGRTTRKRLRLELAVHAPGSLLDLALHCPSK
jgi:23S rRNA-/tRNA-specific pseudouridylate synthase